MKKKSSRLTKNLIEMGKDLKEIGLIDEETHKQIKCLLLHKSSQNDRLKPVRTSAR